MVPYFYAEADGGIAGRPAIVVGMEGYGITPQLLRVAQRLAGLGYSTLTPDLYYRFGGTDEKNPQALYAQVNADDALADIDVCVERARTLGASSVGILGFCMGGRLAYLSNLAGQRVDASVCFYGTIQKLLGSPPKPQLCFFGTRDDFVPSDAVESIRAHHPDDTFVYEGAEHGFMRDGSDAYHPQAAADAWSKTVAFLGGVLK